MHRKKDGENLLLQLKEVVLKKADYLVSKKIILESEVFNLIKLFFKGYLELDSELSFSELISKVESLTLEESVKKNTLNFMKSLSALIYSGKKFHQTKLHSLIDEFKKLIVALIAEKKKNTVVEQSVKKVLHLPFIKGLFIRKKDIHDEVLKKKEQPKFTSVRQKLINDINNISNTSINPVEDIDNETDKKIEKEIPIFSKNIEVNSQIVPAPDSGGEVVVKFPILDSMSKPVPKLIPASDIKEKNSFGLDSISEPVPKPNFNLNKSNIIKEKINTEKKTIEQKNPFPNIDSSNKDFTKDPLNDIQDPKKNHEIRESDFAVDTVFKNDKAVENNDSFTFNWSSSSEDLYPDENNKKIEIKESIKPKNSKFEIVDVKENIKKESPKFEKIGVKKSVESESFKFEKSDVKADVKPKDITFEQVEAKKKDYRSLIADHSKYSEIHKIEKNIDKLKSKLNKIETKKQSEVLDHLTELDDQNKPLDEFMENKLNSSIKSKSKPDLEEIEEAILRQRIKNNFPKENLEKNELLQSNHLISKSKFKDDSDLLKLKNEIISNLGSDFHDVINESDRYLALKKRKKYDIGFVSKFPFYLKFNHILDELTLEIKNKDIASAKRCYFQLCSIYASLDDKEKQMLYPDLNTAYKNLLNIEKEGNKNE